MTKKAPRFDSHVSDFLEVESLKAAADQAAKDRAARAWAYREGYAIAPAKAPQEAPLCPSRPALARLAAIQAGAF